MTIHYHRDGVVGLFTIDSGKHNVLRPDMYEPLYRALYDFLEDDTVKVGVLRGAEGRSFSAGDDIKSQIRNSDQVSNWVDAILKLHRDKPMIAAVDGWCLGQGFIFLMTLTDIRLATPDAKFGLPEIQYGYGGASGAARLGQQLPHNLALYFALTGDYFSAEQARDAFIINEVVNGDSLMTRALEIAHRIARHPLISIRTEMEAFKIGTEIMRGESIGLIRSIYDMQRRVYEAAAGGRTPVTFEKLQQAAWRHSQSRPEGDE